ncbi:cbb3-type cytochrome oxidase assembly protein CcoS [Bradyrhizobium ontarionense]|uniref:Cbb3-type cytochrome oxidase assembly protein CcoS n=1 Tax=Bradyrhizobium ontarionense TaxID=2898149 RepID=A0ABY3R5Y4_9BRAD|nr:cbb3-type cytochrome oxidase assembly protein CcoS [Bradyrhizobium sp. A19]UFZ02720.1 cbb3-type cytochrome oxidase assembly protein CcoS [Bradyrhizobium sp. A19]
MDVLLVLVPIALALGTLGLFAFFWAIKGGQYEDLQGAAERILYDEDPPNQKEI